MIFAATAAPTISALAARLRSVCRTRFSHNFWRCPNVGCPFVFDVCMGVCVYAWLVCHPFATNRPTDFQSGSKWCKLKKCRYVYPHTNTHRGTLYLVKYCSILPACSGLCTQREHNTNAAIPLCGQSPVWLTSNCNPTSLLRFCAHAFDVFRGTKRTLTKHSRSHSNNLFHDLFSYMYFLTYYTVMSATVSIVCNSDSI